MNESALRKKAEKLRTFTDAAWRFLDFEGYVQDAREKDFDEDQVAEIVRAIDHHKANMWGPGKGGKTVSEDAEDAKEGADSEAHSAPFAVCLTDAEYERSLLLIETQARVAAKDPRVEKFRERHCSDGLLSAEGAEAFLESPDAPGLETLAGHLQRFHGWHKGEAAWWVLTGEAPNCRPVKVSYRAAESWHSPDLYLITIEAPPWISPTTFQGAFAEMRRRMHAERKSPEARSVRVVRFVEMLRNGLATENLAFREMCRRWNKKNPDEAFSKSRTFETVYRRIAGILNRQYNTETEREETPELSRQRARRNKETRALRERFAEHRPS